MLSPQRNKDITSSDDSGSLQSGSEIELRHVQGKMGKSITRDFKNSLKQSNELRSTWTHKLTTKEDKRLSRLNLFFPHKRDSVFI